MIALRGHMNSHTPQRVQSDVIMKIEDDALSADTVSANPVSYYANSVCTCWDPLMNSCRVALKRKKRSRFNWSAALIVMGSPGRVR